MWFVILYIYIYIYNLSLLLGTFFSMLSFSLSWVAILSWGCLENRLTTSTFSSSSSSLSFPLFISSLKTYSSFLYQFHYHVSLPRHHQQVLFWVKPLKNCCNYFIYSLSSSSSTFLIMSLYILSVVACRLCRCCRFCSWHYVYCLLDCFQHFRIFSFFYNSTIFFLLDLTFFVD